MDAVPGGIPKVAIRRHNGVALAIVIVLATLAAGLAYLRDPPWLVDMTSGLGEWQTAADGSRFRWARGHASFFIPSHSRVVEIPLRTSFDKPDDSPIVASITLDDRLVDRVVLADAAWRFSVVRLPAPKGRRVRRIDVRLDRLREEGRGAAIGELKVR